MAPPTYDVESDTVGGVVLFAVGADLTVIEPFVCLTNILNAQSPLARWLSVVDADASVGDECKQTDCQRMIDVITTPDDLHHVT